MMINNNYCPEAYPKAVFRPDDYALVFYYDNFDHGMEGLVFPVPDYAPGIHRYVDVPFETFVDTCVNSIPWIQDIEVAERISGVIFDQSFRNYRPNYCTGWFCDLIGIEGFIGLENLNTSHVLDMSMMFCGCGVENLALTSFDTRYVEGMIGMFMDCPLLKFLDISSFQTNNLRYSANFIDGCSELRLLWTNHAVSRIVPTQKPKKKERCRPRSI